MAAEEELNRMNIDTVEQRCIVIGVLRVRRAGLGCVVSATIKS